MAVDHRPKIIESVFSRRNAAGELEESYVSHVKIWEEAENNSRKPRYILLSQGYKGNGFIHKSKLNSNGSFSVGKTWRLPELRAISVTSTTSFNITLSRTYKWQTEDVDDQHAFIDALIQLFNKVTGGNATLQVDGFDDQQHGRQRVLSDYMRPERTPSPSTSRISPYASAPRDERAAPSRSSSPSQSTRGSNSRPPPSRNRAPSPAYSQASSLPSSRMRSSSHSSSTVRQSFASTVTSIPPPPASAAPSARSSPKINRTTPSSSSVDIPASLRIPSPAPPREITRTTPASSIDLPAALIPGGRNRSPTPREMARTTPSSSIDASFSRTPAAEPRPRRDSSPPSQPQPRKPTRGLTIYDSGSGGRREQNARISYFDPANQAMIDRLIGGANDAEAGEEENTQATMANVEEMIEGYEWASEDVFGRKTARGAAELIEARLLDELMALEKANIHSFLESDDRIGVVLKFMDEAITELDNMGSLVSSYKIHLNAVGDDISHIQSQNRGLQVQTQNQKSLLAEIENLMQTVQVDQEVLRSLSQESLEKASSIQRLEEAASELYKALLAGKDTDMAATMERLQEYRTHNAQFCKRVYDFLSIMFSAQSKLLLADNEGIVSVEKRRPTIASHRDLESYLGRYSGLMLYLKEMDEAIYGRVCAAYFSAASDLHGVQMKALMSSYMKYVKKSSEEELDQGYFAGTTPNAGRPSGMKRAGTLIRSPMEGRRDKDKSDGNLKAAEVLDMVLSQIAPLITHEDDFITDFLQINDAALTFADYMGLDNYFRHEALAKDKMQVYGLLACLERFISDTDEMGGNFLLGVLDKQQMRLKGLLDRHINEQIQIVEATKLTSKKRKGVAPFVKHFPIYIGRVEAQLIGFDDLEIRSHVDTAYEKIVQTMFESLKQMAKLDGAEGEDKGQLNYHVILIENMHHFVAETSQLELGSAAGFLRKAEAIYDENLSAYVKIVLRRPFARIIDYFEGVERLLKTTAPTEVATNSSYNRHSLKKVVKEYSSKDVRKYIDALFKRVEKHFTEASEKTTTEEIGGIAPGTVMVGVWKACEEELLRITELFGKRIAQCYPDAGVVLDYTPGDVEGAFRRHRVGS
ncbi:exocyst complex component Sec3-domain-containing protein [Mucidula mucida]|nr:exocyst complex component Sec3-domain-containing protein [Mucidula mucida]